MQKYQEWEVFNFWREGPRGGNSRAVNLSQAAPRDISAVAFAFASDGHFLLTISNKIYKVDKDCTILSIEVYKKQDVSLKTDKVFLFNFVTNPFFWEYQVE